MMVSDVFDIRPRQWWLRGDPYLWDELKKEFDLDINSITNEQFKSRLISLFEDKIGETLAADEMVYIEKYAHGEMSSGHIDITIWRERLVTLLLDSFNLMKYGDEDE